MLDPESRKELFPMSSTMVAGVADPDGLKVAEAPAALALMAANRHFGKIALTP